MKHLLLAATTLALLAGCREAAEGTPENQAESAAENNARTAPENGAVTDNTAAVSTLPATAASAQDAPRLMKQRHEDFERIGDAMKVVSRELKGDKPNLDNVRQGAGTIAGLASEMLGWFPPGTGPDVGKTEAKAEIWQKPQDFTAKSQAFTQAARAFQAAAQGNDLAAIRAAHGNLGKSCKACHDLYREEH
jgi:cytochrome c556